MYHVFQRDIHGQYVMIKAVIFATLSTPDLISPQSKELNLLGITLIVI
ncbi:MAG: hypothetical protein JWR76_1934 [Mucilaginibacter sp.]|nr:hypothetical protein [Mucilaginibacter sp.]